MISLLAAGSRFIEIEHSRVCQSEYFDPTLHDLMDAALDDFASFHGLSVEEILSIYLKFVRSYSKDLKAFWASGRYPMDVDSDPRSIDRVTYDVALIVSTLVSVPRFRMMERIYAIGAAGDLGEVALVGIGPGLELNILRESAPGCHLVGFDPNVSGFAEHRFGKEMVRAETFDGGPPAFDHIFAIELLEHLDAPEQFVADCTGALLPGGRLTCTTAVNMPQFDHVTNFVDEEFESACAAIGLEQEKRYDLHHDYMAPGEEFRAKNVFYVFRKPD